jgi:hypothetical protein
MQSSAKDTPLPPSVAVADAQLLKDAQAMVLRDRNHPSVVIWSLCNVRCQPRTIVTIMIATGIEGNSHCVPCLFESQEGGCEIGTEYGGVIGAQFKDVIGKKKREKKIERERRSKRLDRKNHLRVLDSPHFLFINFIISVCR